MTDTAKLKFKKDLAATKLADEAPKFLLQDKDFTWTSANVGQSNWAIAYQSQLSQVFATIRPLLD